MNYFVKQIVLFKVKISGLFTKNDDQLITFSRPVKAVCLDPNFSKTKMFVTGDTSVSLNFYSNKINF
jgi:hypothetical protein